MPQLDRSFAADAASRFEALPADAKPKWGMLTRDGVIGHLIGAFEYSMGRLEALPPQQGPPLKGIVKYALIYGLVPIPKNVKFKGNDGDVLPPIHADGDTERLREILDEFISGVEQGDIHLIPHPVFGAFSPKQMSMFHYRHVLHHLKQFGA